MPTLSPSAAPQNLPLTAPSYTMPQPLFSLYRNGFGQLVVELPDGTVHTGVAPVRAFPIAAPGAGMSLVNTDGHEVVWMDHWSGQSPAIHSLLQEEVAAREFVPTVLRIISVSTFSTPTTWHVETDRGPTQFVLKAEDDIRRLGGGALLIAAAHGVQFMVPDTAALDRPSCRLLERFL